MENTENIKSKLSKFRDSRLFFLTSSWLGTFSYFYGPIHFNNGVGEETNIQNFLENFQNTSDYYGEQIYQEGNLVLSKKANDGEGGATDVVAGYMTFSTVGNPHILESNGFSSLTCLQNNEFHLNFTVPNGNYICLFDPGSTEKITVSKAQESEKIKIFLNKSFEGIIKIFFLKQILTYSK